MEDIVELVIPWAVTTYYLFALLAWDEHRLARVSPAMLARAWPPTTRSVAIVYFGVLAIPVHFGRTRRSVLGVLQGLAWATAIGLVNKGVADGLDELISRLSPVGPS
jgi:hypothetical protein